MATAGRSGLFLVCERITITLHEVKRAIDVSVKMNFMSSFLAGLLQLFEESTMETFVGLVYEIAAGNSASAPDPDVWLAFAKSAYMLRGFIPIMKDKDLENVFIKDLEYVSKTFQRLFEAVSFGASTA